MNRLSSAKPLVYVIFAGCALVLSCQAGAALYKSVDEKGNVTYSDKPPMKPKEDNKTSQLYVPPPADPDAAKKLVQQEAEFQKRTNEREKAATDAAEQQKQQRELERYYRDARININQYRDFNMRLHRAGETPGERAVMTNEEREKEAVRLEEEMKKAGCP